MMSTEQMAIKQLEECINLILAGATISKREGTNAGESFGVCIDLEISPSIVKRAELIKKRTT